MRVLYRLKPVAFRFQIDERCAVETVEAANQQKAPFPLDERDDGGADRVGPDG